MMKKKDILQFIIFSLLLHERKCPKERVFPDDWASLGGYPWTIQSLREKHALTSSDQRQVHMADWGWGWNNWKYLHSIIKKNRGMDADRQATIPTAAVLLELQHTHKPCWGSPQMHIQIQQVCSGDKHPALPAACGSRGAAGPPGTHRSYSTPVSGASLKKSPPAASAWQPSEAVPSWWGPLQGALWIC